MEIDTLGLDLTCCLSWVKCIDYLLIRGQVANKEQYRKMQQLVESIEHPIGLLFRVGKNLRASGDKSLPQVNEEMRHGLQEHHHQNGLQGDTPADETDTY